MGTGWAEGGGRNEEGRRERKEKIEKRGEGRGRVQDGTKREKEREKKKTEKGIEKRGRN